MANPSKGPFLWAATDTAELAGYNTMRALVPANAENVDFDGLLMALRNLLRCHNYFPCLHAGRVNGFRISGDGTTITLTDGATGGTTYTLTPLDALLTALAASTGTGFPVVTVNGATATVVFRTITIAAGSAAAASLADGDGIAGNPTLSIDATLIALAGLNTTAGFVVQTGTDTFTKRTPTASEGVQVANGDGVAGAPAFKLDVGGLTEDTAPAVTDMVPFYDVTEGVHNKVKVSDLATALGAGNVTTSDTLTADNLVMGNGTVDVEDSGIAYDDVVTAPIAFGTDLRAIISDGTGKAVQVSPVTINDSTGDTSGVGTLASGAIDSTGHVKSSSATAGIGYATGAGGTVTQVTNKSTGVTLNTVTGQIEMHGAALAAGASVKFVVTCSAVGTTDFPLAIHSGGGTLGSYRIATCEVDSGVYSIVVDNITTGSLSEAIILTVMVFKGVTS